MHRGRALKASASAAAAALRSETQAWRFQNDLGGHRTALGGLLLHRHAVGQSRLVQPAVPDDKIRSST